MVPDRDVRDLQLRQSCLVDGVAIAVADRSGDFPGGVPAHATQFDSPSHNHAPEAQLSYLRVLPLHVVQQLADHRLQLAGAVQAPHQLLRGSARLLRRLLVLVELRHKLAQPGPQLRPQVHSPVAKLVIGRIIRLRVVGAVPAPRRGAWRRPVSGGVWLLLVHGALPIAGWESAPCSGGRWRARDGGVAIGWRDAARFQRDARLTLAWY